MIKHRGHCRVRPHGHAAHALTGATSRLEWHPTEYQKLPRYDGDTMAQSPALFFCHQKDGHLCAGWLACHDTDHLLALRMNRVDESAYGYETDVAVYSSGAEACAHGLRGIDKPPPLARRMMAKIARKRSAGNRR
jgi:hypothetical protein